MLREDLIDLPRRWKKPRVIFVNSMSACFKTKCQMNSSAVCPTRCAIARNPLDLDQRTAAGVWPECE
jgi:hypothetical protein